MKWIFSTIFFWLVFVLSLAGWWLYFGITTLSRTTELGSQLARHQRMLFMEGTVLMALLLIGGLSLFYLAYRMYKEKSAKEMFFASFTHDMKTSLFRLQLELEKLSKQPQAPAVDNLFNQTRTMQLDLENSLDSTVGAGKPLFIETIEFNEFLSELHTQWPEFRIKVSGEKRLSADRKALYSIFKNLLHNSFLHGEADEVIIHIELSDNSLKITYSDNGQPFQGDLKELGQQMRFSAEGTGYGLFIVQQWAKQLRWQLDFQLSPSESLQVVFMVPRKGRL